MIDAHLHFWNAEHAVHNWPESVTGKLRCAFTPDDLKPQLAEAGVESVVLMQSRNDFEESLHFSRLAGEHDFIGALVGWVDLADPDNVDAALDRLAQCGKLRGVRHLINFEPDPDWLRADPVQRSVARIAARGLVFDVVPTDDRKFAAVLDLARDHPGLKVLIDHMGRPPVGRERGKWFAQIEAASALANVTIKLSVGLDVLIGWTWSTGALEPYARQIFDCFGPDRVLAASNWPVVLASAPRYADFWRELPGLLTHLDDRQRAAVLGENARALFSIGS